MKRRWKFLAISGVFMSGLLAVNGVVRADGVTKPTKEEVAQKIQKLQMPFIANEGQADEKVKFYANTFGGTVFVTRDGEIVYSLPKHQETTEEGRKCRNGETGNVGWIKQGESTSERLEATENTGNTEKNEKYLSIPSVVNSNASSVIVSKVGWVERSETQQSPPQSEVRNPKSSGVVLKEELVGGRIFGVKGEGEAVTKVSYFKGNDPSKWKSNISTYEMVDLGEVYKGIDLKLKAYGKNVEKLFTVEPGASPEQIKIRLSGLQPSENPPHLSPSGRGTGGCPPLAGAGGGLGARGLSVNEHGELVAETELGTVKFTKPVAYQEIDGKRVDVECGYVIAECEGISPQNTRKDTKLRFLDTFAFFSGLSEVLNTQYVISRVEQRR